MSAHIFLVQKKTLAQTELRQAPVQPLVEGQVRVGIDKFALTSNNITYAAFGDAMNYWGFFPVSQLGAGRGDSGADDASWGCIPVWGFGSVVESRHAELAVGERLYGYFPMASSVVLQPSRANATSFYDGAAHRSSLHTVYNQYLRCAQDDLYTQDTEDVQALLRPLFTTAWLIDDFMADAQFFGAASQQRPGALLLSSASSKTAYSTAFWLKQRSGVEVVGLTSAANAAFCESLGCYDRVLRYDQLAQIPADRPCVYVDFAGNADLRLAIHSRFSQLKYSCSIGGTHLENLGGAKDLPGPRATLFFAPAQIKKRALEWGADGFKDRVVQAWKTFMAQANRPGSAWVQAVAHTGPSEVAAAYAQVLQGRGDARQGHILSLP